jgi:hypothetical protein
MQLLIRPTNATVKMEVQIQIVLTSSDMNNNSLQVLGMLLMPTTLYANKSWEGAIPKTNPAVYDEYKIEEQSLSPDLWFRLRFSNYVGTPSQSHYC